MDNHKKYVLWMIDIAKLLAVVCGATLLGILFVKVGFPETNIVVIYIFAVLLVARFTKGYFYGILSSVVCLLCFNYFFTAPYHTLAVNDPSYMITFCIMLITALITSALTTKEKLMTMEATRKGMESQTLYMLSNKLSDAADIEAVIKIAAESMSRLLQVNVGCIYVGEQAEPIYIQQLEKEQLHRSVTDVDEIRRKFTNLRTEYLENEESWTFPVNGQNRLLAVIMIDRKVSEEELSSNKKLIHSMIENISLALERIEITIERVRDRQRMERERERANLLRAISHDLRTPLSGIMGSAEMLMDMTEKDDNRQKLLKGIYQDADWLKSLVENILSLTRLQDGKLIEQVITNLLDNAVKHTTCEETITVCVSYSPDKAQVTVKDEGEGIAKEDEGNLFQIFYTSKTRAFDVRKGIGLGLTICETVVNAHGGTITGRNREDGKGAEFIFTLPVSVQEE